jgi:putative endonuclease
MPHFVYLLRNPHGRQYVGQTVNINSRLKEHNEGSVLATKGGRPWQVEWFCGFKNKTVAIKFEKYLKSGSGRSFRDRHLLSE